MRLRAENGISNLPFTFRPTSDAARPLWGGLLRPASSGSGRVGVFSRDAGEHLSHVEGVASGVERRAVQQPESLARSVLASQWRTSPQWILGAACNLLVILVPLTLLTSTYD